MSDDWIAEDRDGQRLDVNELLSRHMEQVVRAVRAEAQVQRVRELHYGYDAMDGLQRCGCCGYPWPCLTALAVKGDSDE